MQFVFTREELPGLFFPREEMACLVDVTGCWWRRSLHCTQGAVSYIGVLTAVHRNSGRLLNFQEFCEQLVRTTDTLKLAVQQCSNGTNQGVSCLFDTTLIPFSSSTTGGFFWGLKRKWTLFLAVLTAMFCLFLMRDSLRTLKVLDSFESYSALLKQRSERSSIFSEPLSSLLYWSQLLRKCFLKNKSKNPRTKFRFLAVFKEKKSHVALFEMFYSKKLVNSQISKRLIITHPLPPLSMGCLD